MAKAIKLASGRWRCQVYDYTDENGKIHRKSFTADTKREVERLAAIWQSDREVKKNADMTLGEAMDAYIASKNNILSPGTIKTYTGYRRNHFNNLKELPIGEIQRDQVQRYINSIAATSTPKTVYNIHGFIYAVLKEYQPDLVLNTKLPQKKKTDMAIPTKAQLDVILSEAEKIEDKALYLAILLASHLGLRRGEVCALNWDDINTINKEVFVSKSLSITPQNDFIEKAPKSYSGYRTVPIPSNVAKKLDMYRSEGRVINISPSQLTNRWKRFKKRISLDQFSYHSLRHYYASAMLDLGVPDKYAMEIMGHSTNKILRDVYQHVNTNKLQEVANKLDHYFD